MILHKWKLSFGAIFSFLILNLTACQLSNSVVEDIRLQPVQAYLRGSDLYIDVLSSRELHTLSDNNNELLSRIECMYDENQKNIFNKNFTLRDNEIILDNSYDDRKLIQEKSTSTQFYYQVKLMGFIKKQTLFYNNTMSCRFMVGKLVGGKSISNVIQFDMSKINAEK